MIAQILLALGLGFVGAWIGGALMGQRIGAAALGVQMARYMGSFYGMLAGVPGVVLGVLAVVTLR